MDVYVITVLQKPIDRVDYDRYSILAVYNTYENAKNFIDRIIEDAEKHYNNYDGGFKVTKENLFKEGLEKILDVSGECVRDVNIVFFLGNRHYRYIFYIRREPVMTSVEGL